ncbi:hypothetical protein [Glaciimonas soli]|uniref:Uncharacterized protein n=1 Tax=Glaciimonas soli TaxID=2590999 RepID=A0A843YRH0_9BURK|nr:hypothetical protein [Glaciimonas soli]MQR02349.1 hypothetical protein [Glaciimonas soli]
MSLEAKIEELNQTIHRLIDVLTTSLVPVSAAKMTTDVTATVGEVAITEKKTRTKKTAAPAIATAAQPAKPTPLIDQLFLTSAAEIIDTSVILGDAPGTRYFKSDVHNSEWRVRPGDPDADIEGKEEMSAADFLLRQEAKMRIFARQQTQKLEAQPTASAVAPVTSEPTAIPATAVTALIATVPVVTVLDGPNYLDVVAKLQELLKDKGKDCVSALLATFGIKNVQTLQDDHSQYKPIMHAIDAALLGLA